MGTGLSHKIKRLSTKFLKFSEILAFCISHHIGHFLCEDKFRSFSIYAVFLLEVSQKVSKVNMKQMSRFFHHDIPCMSIPNSQNKSSHTVTSAAANEIIDCYWNVFLRIMYLEVIKKCFLFQCTKCPSQIFMNAFLSV